MSLKTILTAVACALCLSIATVSQADAVYVTKNGKKFHKADCELIKKSELTELDDAQAAEQGYAPCKKCFKEKIENHESEEQK